MQVNNFFSEVIQHIDEQIYSSSIAIGTPLKNDKGIHMDEIESSDMDIDGVHVSKNPRISQNIEAKIESDEYFMIVDSVPKNVTLVPPFKVEHLP